MNEVASSLAMEAASVEEAKMEKAEGDGMGNLKKGKGGGEEKMPFVVSGYNVE
jgi:hypothetical protein